MAKTTQTKQTTLSGPVEVRIHRPGKPVQEFITVGKLFRGWPENQAGPMILMVAEVKDETQRIRRDVA